MTLALRPLIAANFSDKLLTMYIIHILSVPAVIEHVKSMAPEVIIAHLRRFSFNGTMSILYFAFLLSASLQWRTTNFLCEVWNYSALSKICGSFSTLWKAAMRYV